MRMELLEMELIKKLQNTQAIQKQAYMDLEQAIQQKNMLGEGSESQLYHSQPGGNMNNMNNGGDMA